MPLGATCRRRAHAGWPSRSRVIAASKPLLPPLAPARSMACSSVLVVSTPNATGTPVSAATCASPLAASAGDVVEVRRLAADHRAQADDRVVLLLPRQFRGHHRHFPGARALSRYRSGRRLPPARVSASIAPPSSRSVMKLLKRLTMIANRSPAADSCPSITLRHSLFSCERRLAASPETRAYLRAILGGARSARTPRPRTAGLRRARRRSPVSTASRISAERQRPVRQHLPQPRRGSSSAAPPAAPRHSPARCGAPRPHRSGRPRAAFPARVRGRPGAAGAACRRIRAESELHFRLPELRVRRANAHRARHRQLQPAAQRETVHRGHRRLPHGLQAPKDTPARAAQSRASSGDSSRQFVDIGAGHEGLFAGAGQRSARESPDRSRTRRKASSSSHHRRRIERVQLLRPVDGDERNTVRSGLKHNVVVGHMGY